MKIVSKRKDYRITCIELLQLVASVDWFGGFPVFPLFGPLLGLLACILFVAIQDRKLPP